MQNPTGGNAGAASAVWHEDNNALTYLESLWTNIGRQLLRKPVRAWRKAVSRSVRCLLSTARSPAAGTTAGSKKGIDILHAEMDCLENAGRLAAGVYARLVLNSTLSTCDICVETVLSDKIPKVIAEENRTSQGPETYLRQRVVDLEIRDDEICVQFREKFIRERPALWNENIRR